MIRSFFYTSENKNLYINDDQSRLSMLAHPELKKTSEKSTDVDSYYVKKYAYLKAHGFFTKSKPTEFAVLEESIVEDNIKNIKQVVFEVTDSCNLSCTYCAFGELYDGYDERISKKIDIHKAIHLLKFIFDHKPKKKNDKLAISFYGGEPLLNMTFIEQIVELSKELNLTKQFDLEYTMTTNTTLLHKYMDFLVANNFRLLISLDGNEKCHSYRTFKKDNENSFQKVIENLDRLQKDYPDYFLKNISFNAVLHDRNTIKEIYEFIYTRYNKIPRVSELNTRHIRPCNKDRFNSMYHSVADSDSEFRKEDSELARLTHKNSLSYMELTNYLKYISINYYISNIRELLYSIEKQLPTSTCTPFSKKVLLTNRNKLLPCERIDYRYSMGKVDEDIEFNIPEITRQYNFYYKHIQKFCQTCYVYKYCGSCLFHIENIDKANEEGFVCQYHQNQKDFENSLRNIFTFLEKYPQDYAEIVKKCSNRIKIMKNVSDYWFTIEPYVFVDIKSKHVLLYNTLDGVTIESTNEKIVELLQETLQEENCGVALLTHERYRQEEICCFVDELREKFMGDVINVSLSDGKPIQILPFYNYSKEQELYKKNNFSSYKNILEKLFEISLHIDATTNITKLIHFLITLPKNLTFNIVGNMEEVPNYGELFSYLDHCSSPKNLLCSYKNIIALQPIFAHNFSYQISVSFPIDVERWNHAIKVLLSQTLPVEFVFEVSSEEDVQQSERLIEQYQIDKYRLKPNYTGNNIRFFENEVFLSKEDILSTPMTMKDFFARQAMNLYDFGKITILPNGDVYANLNHPSLGNIYVNNIHEILHKEVEEGKSWFRVRNHPPCTDCVYQWICPSPSNYEIAIGRSNLCHVKE